MRNPAPALVALLPLILTAAGACGPSAGGEDIQPEAVEPSEASTTSRVASDASTPVSDPQHEAGTVVSTADGCIADGDPFDEAKMRAHLSYLASPELAGRAPGSPGDKAARKYVEDRLKCLGILPGAADGSYLQPFVDSNGTSSGNIIGMIPGTDPVVGKDILVIGAHIDHFGTIGGKGLRLGANDNASGVTTVLTLAQAFKQRATAPKRTVAFMFYGSEELGCDGSHYYVDHSTPALPFAKVVYDINFDMVGSYTVNGKQVDAHGTYPTTPGLAALKKVLGTTPPLKINLGVPGLGEDDSDYWAFCAKAVPIVAFFTDDPPCYHKACDTADKIDYPNMSKLAKIGADLAAELADSATDLAAYRKQAKVKDLGCE
jgi:hypothetical protein